MKITPVQKNRNESPAFKMNLTFKNPKTRELLKRDVEKFYNSCVPSARDNFFGTEPLDPEKIISSLQMKFNEMTGKVHGNAEIEMVNADKPTVGVFFKVNFTDKKGKTYYSSDKFMTRNILPNSLFDDDKPYKSAVKSIVAKISDSIAVSGVGHHKENKINSLLDHLRFE